MDTSDIIALIGTGLSVLMSGAALVVSIYFNRKKLKDAEKRFEAANKRWEAQEKEWERQRRAALYDRLRPYALEARRLLDEWTTWADFVVQTTFPPDEEEADEWARKRKIIDDRIALIDLELDTTMTGDELPLLLSNGHLAMTAAVQTRSAESAMEKDATVTRAKESLKSALALHKTLEAKLDRVIRGEHPDAPPKRRVDVRVHPLPEAEEQHELEETAATPDQEAER